MSNFILDNDTDLLFLTETWLRLHRDEAKCAGLAPSGYAIKSFHRPLRGGGLAVIFRDSLFTSLTSSTTFTFDHSRCKLVQVSLTLQYKALHFFGLYRQPSNRKNKLTEAMFPDQFPDLLDHCNQRPYIPVCKLSVVTLCLATCVSWAILTFTLISLTIPPRPNFSICLLYTSPSPRD